MIFPMSGSLWISFVGAKAIISVTQGPAVMLVVSHGLERGRTPWAAMGIVLVNALYFVLAAMGLGAVLWMSPTAFIVMKWAACAYLIYSGIRALTAQLVPDEAKRSGEIPVWRSCGAGMLLQLANPNALLFFVAVLPTFVDPHQRLTPQVTTLGATALILDCIVLAGYGSLAGKLRQWADAPEFRLMASRIAGFLLVATGVFTAAMR